MSGVVDRNGVQWERCTICADWVRIDDLGFLPKNVMLKLPHGADACLKCANSVPGLAKHVQPARTWQAA